MNRLRRFLKLYCTPGNIINKCAMWYLGLSGFALLILGIYNTYNKNDDIVIRYGSFAGVCMAAFVIFKNYRLASRIKKSLFGGTVLEWLLPPDEADHRIIELDEAMDRWVSKYGQKRAEILYIWQSLISAALFWFDRVVVKVLARK